MNGIERPLGLLFNQLKQIKLTFTFISLSILLAVASVALLANVANAQEEPPVEQRAALDNDTQVRVVNLAANMSNKMQAVLNRLWDIAGRLEERISIMTSEGINTSAARDNLEAAKTSIEAGIDTISNIDNEVVAFTGSASPQEQWVSVRETYTTTKGHIKSAYQDLKAVIKELKSPEMMTTETNTTENESDESVTNEQ